MAVIGCVNILTSVVVLIAFLPSQLEAYYTPNTGCHHNGTWYADKSLVPTTEKCLNCQCSKKTLVCRLKVCPEMPMPPPRGCVVVQKKNTCCPYLSCARLDAFYKIPATRRIIAYLDHYERESIDRVVNENMLQRRSDDTDVDLFVCVKNGTVYKSGSAMSSSNLCSYCYCIGGTEKCVKPKCMLPVEGCKPIFVDSTCCPVRYDCSTKQTGKSSQEVRYRKTSNKHYMRMSQRLQRNRGCTVGQQFYVEGQKMKSDKDKPCDICFCIRGQRKCAPKKCAPALRNCIPVVPKGQCCPSSYDCGSQRDYRRAQNSRQFNLFSLLFGKDDELDGSATTDIAIQYPHDRDPAMARPVKQKTATTERSIFDTIREGLEFIDSNNNQMLKDNEDLLTEVKHVRPSPTPIPLSMLSMPSTTEVSFFDLLLGPSQPNSNHNTKVSEENTESESSGDEETTPTSTVVNWVDLLLGPDEEDDLKSSDNGEEIINFESTTTTEDNLLKTTTEEPNPTEETITMEETTPTLGTTLTDTTEEIKSTHSTKIITENTTRKSPATTMATTSPTTTTPTTTTTARPSSTTTRKPLKTTTWQNKFKTQPMKPIVEPVKNSTHQKSDFLAQLLDGLSDILVGENKTSHSKQKPLNLKLNFNKTTTTTTTTTTNTVKLPTPKPMPMFKPLPMDKTYTRINSKIANLTIKAPIIATKDAMKTTFISLPPHMKNNSTKPLLNTTKKPEATTLKPITSNQAKVTTNTTSTTTTSTTPAVLITTTTDKPVTTTTTTTTTTTSSTTLKPVLIKTNPSILEAEPLDEDLAPTLPPSLPNLKIIPFLPTDAVKADHNTGSSYDFYHHSAAPISRIDYELYDDANLYPSITEKYPLYPDLEDGSKAEYIYKFNVEGPDSLVSSNAGKFDGTLGAPAFLKYDFAGSAASSSTKGFSPPTKTEGGFVPKEPLIIDDDEHSDVSVNVGDSYHVTQHIIDITTSSADVLNATKVIEITTPDPFKDVIRTEPPPDLTSLIEDKLKNLITKSSTTITTNGHVNGKPQTVPEIETHSKPTEDTNPMNTKTETQIKIKMTDTMNMNKYSDNNNGTAAQTAHTSKKSVGQPYRQSNDDDMLDEANVDVNDYVTTIPPFKTLPTLNVQQEKQQQLTEGNITKPKLSVSLETATAMDHVKLNRKQTMTTSRTTKRPTTTMTTMATIKVNRNKTIANNTTTPQRIQQQKPLKIKNPTTLNASETKILASSSASTTTTNKSSSGSSLSSATAATSGGSVSTMKTKSNATRRVASAKPTKHNNKMTTNNTTTTTVKNTGKPGVINIERTSVSHSRRTVKPTTKANATTTVTKMKIATQTTAKTTTTTTPSPIATSTTTRRPTPAPVLHQVKVQTTMNPFLMSPFDKLPFMDASFEVKRNSATPSTITTASNANTSLQQHFAVQATITDANYGQDVANDASLPLAASSSSSRHKLMGLVHYKHTLNQLEGLEPQHSPLSAAQFSQVSSPSSSSPSTSTSALAVNTASASSTSSATSTSSALNSLIDPTGILKLAGCNIYGRMYRVGRIILELSSPCLECKCTEIGVKCGPLDC
ncbi:hypothetical protein DOY81_007678 [Sarcophaga bullata]|nr:hypothetical protein DOY81_007678 [Sarcophaga bullata]